MALSPIGDSSIAFGVPDDEGFTACLSVQVTQKVEKKEGKDSKGNVAVVMFMNPTTEITVEGYGEKSPSLGSSFGVSSFSYDGSAYVEEVTKTASNEDFVKTTIKAIAWPAIS